MIIYPAIDLKDGDCVRLQQGQYDRVTVYDRDPVQVAQRLEKLGAQALHLVDLDGAKEGRTVNQRVIQDIVSNISIPVQLGGGIRESRTVASYLEMGVSQVILGTSALEDRRLLQDLLQAYGPRIIVAVDVRDNYVAAEGWKTTSGVKAVDYIKELEPLGLTRVVYTDIAKDGMLQGPNFSIYEQLLPQVGLEIIASGGITSLSDISKLRGMGLYGAIIGKALYDGKLSLEECLQC